MIDQSTISRIIDTANIVDVVSEYVTLRRSGTSYKGLCPFHDDKTPSFYVNPARGICKCFSCGEGGNVVHFVMKQEQVTYFEAIKILGKRYGIEVEDKKLSPEEIQKQSERESMFAVNEWASKYFNSVMKDTEDGRAIGLAYFRSRDFRDDIIEKFRLGFCLSEYDAMSKAALKAGYKEEFLVKTGLSYKRDSDGSLRDKYWGRVMFPWFNVSGNIVAFGGRVLDARTKGVNQKYINSPESEIYTKSKELYGLYQAKRAIGKEDVVYMVEGYTDVLSMHQCGIENVVANSGTALNDAQIYMLLRFTKNIVLLYDGDEAGIHAALRGTDMLLAKGMNVKVLLLPDGDDPDSFARKHNATEFRTYVTEHQEDFLIFKTNYLLGSTSRDPIKRAEGIKDIVKSISVIPEEIVRSTYVHACSELTGMKEEVLLREVKKLRREAFEEEKKRREREAEIAKSRGREAKSAPYPAQSAPAYSNVPPPGYSPDDVPPAIPPPDMEGVGIPPEAYQPMSQIPADEGYANVPPPDIPPYEEVPPSQQPPWQDVATTSAQRMYSAEEEAFVGLEKMIMRLVVRYGEKQLAGMSVDGGSISVAEYVKGQILDDGLHFCCEVYERMLLSVCEHVGDDGFDCNSYFMSSPDYTFSSEAALLSSDKYQMIAKVAATLDSARLDENIQHLVYDYKFKVVDRELNKVKAQLADPAVMSDSTKCNEVMGMMMQLNNIRKEIAQAIGAKVVDGHIRIR